MRSAKEYRSEAKKYVAPQKNKLALIYFIYEVIVSVVSFIGATPTYDEEGTFTGMSGGFGSGIIALLAGPFAVSFIIMIIKAFREEKVAVKDLFSGFKKFVPALVLGVVLSIFLTLWTLLLIIPGIIMAFAYEQAYFIFNEHPELKPVECIKKSRAMMKGHKMELFGLLFSYIGHYFLVILTCGIYSFWLMPKVQMAKYLFYQDLKKANGEVEE